jgi:hypothetical protein
MAGAMPKTHENSLISDLLSADFKPSKFARTVGIQEISTCHGQKLMSRTLFEICGFNLRVELDGDLGDDCEEVQMTTQSKRVRQAAAKAVQSAARPIVVGGGEFEAQLDKLRIREKEYTHQGDAIAAERRRLPMVRVNASTTLIGANGPVTLLETFEGRQQLIAYYFMWHKGRRHRSSVRAALGARGTWVSFRTSTPAMLRLPGSLKSLTKKAHDTGISWNGKCRGIPRLGRWNRCWRADGSEGCTLSAICVVDRRFLRRTGRPLAVWK